MAAQKAVPGTGGDHYIPYEQRTGGESAVYFTRDLSAAGLVNICGRIQSALEGRVAVTGSRPLWRTGCPTGPL